MANIVNRWCSYTTTIYIACIVARSIIYISFHPQIGFAIRSIYIDMTHVVATVIWITQVRIIYATWVDIYTETTPRTRTSVAGANAGSERASSLQFIGNWVAVVADRLRKLTGWNAGRALTSAVMSKGWHVGSAPARWFPGKSWTRTEALTNDPLESESEVFREQSVNHRVDGWVAISNPKHNWEKNIVDTAVAKRSN